MSSGEKTVSERAELSTSVKSMDDLPKSKSGESQTKLNKTDLLTSGDDEHVARWVADLEQHLPMDVESVSSSKKHRDSYTVRSCVSPSSTTSKKYCDSVVKARLAAEELIAERELARQKIQEAADRADRAKRRAEERARIDTQRAREQAERAWEQAEENAQRVREEAEEERLRIEEEARMHIEEREKAWKLATVEAEFWERESSCSSHRSFPTGTKRNHGYVCFDRSCCDETQLQPERGLSLHRNKCDVKFRRDGNNERAFQYTHEVGNHRGTYQQHANLYPRRGDIDYLGVGERFLPRPVITKLDGNPMNYKTFIRQFEVHIAQKTRTDELRLFLLQHCEPAVRDKIERFTSVNPCEWYRMAQNELFYEYSQPHVIAQRCKQELKALSDVSPNDSDSLMKLSVLMNKWCTSLEGVANMSSVDTMDVMISIVKKLSIPLRLKWVDWSLRNLCGFDNVC